MRIRTDAQGEPLPVSDFAELQDQAPAHRRRHEAHVRRLAREEQERRSLLAEKKRQAAMRQERGAGS
jgi:hypothetical protein